MENWLQKRLTPAKQKNARWTGLAHVLESLWDANFIPRLSRYQRLRSSFEADDADLAKQIAQMGDYFSYDLPKPEDRAVALAWRRLELEYKDLELILSMALRRHFGSLRIDWFPIYAPKDEPYGTGFIPFDQMRPMDQKNIPLDGYFLTSRGVVAIDKGTLYRQTYYKDTIREDALALVTRIKPIDRIFDYLLWYQYFELPFKKPDFDVTWEVDQYLDFRLDLVRPDENNDFWITSGTKQHFEMPFLPRDNELLYWHLDMFPREGWYPIDKEPVPGFLPVMTWPFRLDRPLPGYEGLRISPMGIVISETQEHPVIPLLAPEITGKSETDRDCRVWDMQAAIGQEQEADSNFVLPFMPTHRYCRLDRFLHNDILSVDMEYPFRLDIALPGIESMTYTPMDVVISGSTGKYALPFADVAHALTGETEQTAHVWPFRVQCAHQGDAEHTQEIEAQEVLAGLDGTERDVWEDLPFEYDLSAESKSENEPVEMAFECESGVEWETENQMPVRYRKHVWGLDRGPRFDEIAADWMPLDYPPGGYLHVV